MAIVIVAIILTLIIIAIIRSQRRKIETGSEGLVGKIAIVRNKLDPKGKVIMDGEIWDAKLDKGTAEVGEEVTIVKNIGLKLMVTKK